MQPLIEFINNKQYLIAAHRGASGLFTENTMMAFEKAIEMQADVIELDIRNTKDNQIICYHDEFFQNNIPISCINYSDLAKNNIPLLKDVLKQFGNKIYFVIEIKLLDVNIINVFLNELMFIIDNLQLYNSIVIASEVSEYLEKIKVLSNNKINTALIYTKNNVNIVQKYYNAIICYVCELDKLDCASDFIGVYGVNSFDEVKKCIKHNVKLIGTDYPLEIRKHLEKLYEKKQKD